MGKYEPQAGSRVSEYVLEERIGAGTFGEVWRARHHVWEKDHVAIKLPTQPEYVRFLQREGIVVHGLRHANIVRVLGLDPYSTPPYMVMELVSGPSLDLVVAEHPKGLPLPLVEIVLRGVLNAMQCAHAAGVLHRDLKPANVLLDLGDRPLEKLRVEDVKVSDFGLGQVATDALRSIAQSASLSREDSLVGTLAYMAPEIREGQQTADARGDLFAIGVILYEILTGSRPAGAELPSGERPEAALYDDVYLHLYARHDRRYESAEAALADLDGATERRGSGGKRADVRREAQAGYARRCSACGSSVDAQDQYCTVCGAQVADAVRRCPACAAYPGVGDRYCIFCGTRLVMQGMG
jgi:serine/threonine protein kinase